MVSTTQDGGWEGEESPDHRRYFEGGIHDHFVADVSDKNCRLIHHYLPNAIALYPTEGTIKRVSSYQDVLGDGKYMEFSGEDYVSFPGQNGRTYIFYRDVEAYQKNSESQEIIVPPKNPTPNWFKDLGLEGAL